MEMYTLPCGTITDNPILAAELWSQAFYQAKDALNKIRPIPETILRGKPVKNLDEILLECDKALELGEK